MLCVGLLSVSVGLFLFFFPADACSCVCVLWSFLGGVVFLWFKFVVCLLCLLCEFWYVVNGWCLLFLFVSFLCAWLSPPPLVFVVLNIDVCVDVVWALLFSFLIRLLCVFGCLFFVVVFS